MILEGIVTSQDSGGQLNIAPMGPIIEGDFETLLLRPFQTSQTYRNLKETRCGVLHVTDDVLLIARAAIGQLNEEPPTLAAERVSGRVLAEACRWFEFEVREIDDSEQRTEMRAEVVYRGWLRDFFGFNRAKHAVLETAILATRVHLLPQAEVMQQLIPFRQAVQKTAGEQERQAFALLEDYIGNAYAG